MKIEQLIAAGQAAFGKHFVAEISERLGVNTRSFRYWLSGQHKIPPLLAADIRLILNARQEEITRVIPEVTDTFLRHRETGVINTVENWHATEHKPGELVEVMKIDGGEWVEI